MNHVEFNQLRPRQRLILASAQGYVLTASITRIFRKGSPGGARLAVEFESLSGKATVFDQSELAAIRFADLKGRRPEDSQKIFMASSKDNIHQGDGAMLTQGRSKLFFNVRNVAVA